jgi:two-component system, NtrC family, sensor kinase
LQLSPKLQATQHRVRIEGDRTLSLNSYPGAFSQIITNLVMNSLLHAFDPEQSGTISLRFSQSANLLSLEYGDDGNGIPPEHLSKIFEPFFTTKRGQGGSGLGLHIAYNLVTQKLGGTIGCESQLGQGTKFMIQLSGTGVDQRG